MAKREFILFVLVSSVQIALAAMAAAQQSASPAPWGGWARCQINVSGQGYSDQQTHTWTISSSASTVSGAFRVYPASWSVAGSGSLQHTQGSQTLMAQWATSAQNLSAPLAVFVRASDGKMFIQARHAQTRAAGSVNGYQQLTIDGKPQKPGIIAAEAFEWAFPVVEVSRPKPGDPLVANGSSTPMVNGKVGYMQPAGTQATASCTWQFGQGCCARTSSGRSIATHSDTSRIAMIDWIAESKEFGPRNDGESPKITDQDDVTAFAASCQGQLPAVMRPGKVKNLSRIKIRNLFRKSTAQFLSPDIGGTVPGQYIFNCLTSGRPARLFAA